MGKETLLIYQILKKTAYQQMPIKRLILPAILSSCLTPPPI
jgi:hypothetical protein